MGGYLSSIDSLLYQPPDTESPGNTRFDYIWIATSQGDKIPCWFIYKGKPVTLLFSHGNAEDLSTLYDWMNVLADRLNVNIFAYEYEGYGLTKYGPMAVIRNDNNSNDRGGSNDDSDASANQIWNTEDETSTLLHSDLTTNIQNKDTSKLHEEGVNVPNEEACYRDIVAAYQYLVDELSISPGNIVIYGRSLGSGPSCFLAEKLSQEGTKIGGLILQSPLSSVFRVVVPFRYSICFDQFCNCDRARNIKTPVLIIHGTNDAIVPFYNGEQLFLAFDSSCRAKPYWVIGGGHNNLEKFAPHKFVQHITDFMQEWIPSFQNENDE